MFDSPSDPSYLASNCLTGVHAVAKSHLADVPIENLFSSAPYVAERAVDIAAFVEDHDAASDLGDEVSSVPAAANNGDWWKHGSPVTSLRSGFDDGRQVTVEQLKELDVDDEEENLFDLRPRRDRREMRHDPDPTDKDGRKLSRPYSSRDRKQHPRNITPSPRH
ncbi:MAG: hypothetical protein AAB776_02555 [Patescibacteria group bacterium]